MVIRYERCRFWSKMEISFHNISLREKYKLLSSTIIPRTEGSNWNKETYPMADEDLGRNSLTITKGNQTRGHVFNVTVELYDMPADLKNHQS